MKLHDEMIVIDATSAIMGPDSQLEYWDRMQAGGVTAVGLTVASSQDCQGTMKALVGWYGRLRKEKHRLLHVTDAAQIRQAKTEGKIGVIFQFQNGNPLEDQPGFVEIFYRLGVRIIQLTYNERNLLADGCTERTDAGLSELGLKVVAEMNRVGMLIDLSHVGYRSSMDAMVATEAPLVFTHANAWSVCPNPRNLRDDQLRALARNGGVVGVTAFPTFVSAEEPELGDMLDHIDYICGLIGPEHVGIGLDICAITDADWATGVFSPTAYSPPPWIFPAGIQGPEDLPNITQGLLSRGYNEQDVRGIMGENFERVFAQVWK